MVSHRSLVRIAACALALATVLPSLETLHASPQQPAETHEGTLHVVWGDPRPGVPAAGTTLFTLALDDGSVLPLQMGDQQGSAFVLFNKRVTVTGRRTDGAGATLPGAAGFVVDSISPVRPDGAAVDVPQSVLGTRKVLFLLVKFSDDAAVPHAPSFYNNLVNPDTSADPTVPATINGFFKKTSANQFSWIGDVGGQGGVGAPGGWITLPSPKSTYAPCGFSGSCANLSLLSNDAITAAKAQGISFSSYDNVNFVLSNDLDCCAWGGGTSVDGKSLGATWEPPWGQETRVYSHEMGHSIGLPHSGWVYYAYDSPWDVMSDYSDNVITACGSYVSRNDGATSTLYCREPGNGYIAAHRDYLGWIPPANEVTADTFGTTSVTLEGASLPMSTGVKLIKICLPGLPCTGSSAHYFSVEARVKDSTSNTLFDHGIPGEGVLIHDVLLTRGGGLGAGNPCFFNTQSGWAIPIDGTPGDYTGAPTCSGTGLRNAQLLPGQSYTNNTYHFKVTVGTRVGQTFNVTVATTSVSQVSIDTPAGGTVSLPFVVSGWALNQAAPSGTGVDAVHVYAFPVTTGSGVFLGAATYGQSRPDVGGVYGASFTNSGWSVAVSSLAPGSYTLAAYAHDALNGTFDAVQTRAITVAAMPSTPVIAIDVPSGTVRSSFTVAGWAIDRAAPSGTGIDLVHVYAYPASGSPIFLGAASYGQARSDVGGVYGGQFTNSGYFLASSGTLTPGSYTLVVFAHSTVSGAFTSQTRSFTVRPPGSPLMSIDTPGAGSAVAQPFLVAGWAVDLDASTGTGVDAVHVWAYPTGGGNPLFAGAATLGFGRPDVGSAFGGQFTNSGYNLTVAGGTLPVGSYTLVAFLHSTVTGTFTPVATVSISVH